MSAGSATGGGGRRGVDPIAVDTGRLFYNLTTRYGISVETIAAVDGISRSLVESWIKLYLDTLAPRRPRKMSQNTLLGKAWYARKFCPALGQLDAADRERWLDALVEINRVAEDGVDMPVGPEQKYHSQEDFAETLGVSPETWAFMVKKGMLLDLDGKAIGLPRHFDMRPPAWRGERPIVHQRSATDHGFDYAMMVEHFGIPVATIAATEGVDEFTVRKCIKLYRDHMARSARR